MGYPDGSKHNRMVVCGSRLDHLSSNVKSYNSAPPPKKKKTRRTHTQHPTPNNGTARMTIHLLAKAHESAYPHRNFENTLQANEDLQHSRKPIKPYKPSEAQCVFFTNMSQR